MIIKLETTPIEETLIGENNERIPIIYADKAPDNFALMNKINEIIDILNEYEKKIDE